MSNEFLLTSLIVVLLPGTGVIYTISLGLFAGRKESIFAAMGCTLGIIPHLLASIFGLAAILHTSAVIFQIIKFIGVLYLFYLAYMMYKETGALQIKNKQKEKGLIKIVTRGFLINILNPKLSIFFLAFLPQFVSHKSTSVVTDMLILSFTFMLLTFFVFVTYGIFADKSRILIQNSPKVIERIQKSFAGIFVLLGIKLATTDR